MTRRWCVRSANRPPRRETGAPISRRRQPPPTHCGAKHRNGRDLIIATRPAHQPLPSLLSAAAAQEVQAIPEPTTMSPTAPIPRDQHRQICTCPPRAKGSLDRRSKRLSFPHFFLRRKKCGRRRPPPRQGETDSPPGRRNPPRAKGFLDRRSKWFSLVTFFLQKKKVTRAGARNSPSRARRRSTCLPPGQRPPPARAFLLSPTAPFLPTAEEMGERTPAETAFLHFLSALCLFAAARAFPHVTGVFLIVVVPPTVPAQLPAAAACYYGKNYSFCRVAG